MDASGARSSFSFGGMYYFAPGEDIRSAFPGGKTAKAKGNFAAPMVSGTLALGTVEVSATYHDYAPADKSPGRDGRTEVEKGLRNLPGFTEPTYQKCQKRQVRRGPRQLERR